MDDANTFGAWVRLDDEGLAQVPDAPAAVQLRREAGLVGYPSGKSAMVYYFYAATSARVALKDAFADELAAPGARGQGPLLVRFATGATARASLEKLYDAFVARFGAPPVLNE